MQNCHFPRKISLYNLKNYFPLRYTNFRFVFLDNKECSCKEYNVTYNDTCLVTNSLSILFPYETIIELLTKWWSWCWKVFISSQLLCYNHFLCMFFENKKSWWVQWRSMYSKSVFIENFLKLVKTIKMNGLKLFENSI